MVETCFDDETWSEHILVMKYSKIQCQHDEILTFISYVIYFNPLIKILLWDIFMLN